MPFSAQVGEDFSALGVLQDARVPREEWARLYRPITSFLDQARTQMMRERVHRALWRNSAVHEAARAVVDDHARRAFPDHPDMWQPIVSHVIHALHEAGHAERTPEQVAQDDADLSTTQHAAWADEERRVDDAVWLARQNRKFLKQAGALGTPERLAARIVLGGESAEWVK